VHADISVSVLGILWRKISNSEFPIYQHRIVELSLYRSEVNQYSGCISVLNRAFPADISEKLLRTS